MATRAKRASGRVTARDLEVLEFVARLGVVPSPAAARWADTARSVTYEREARLHDHGLIEIQPPVGDSGRLLSCTREGLRAVGRTELRPCDPSLGRIPHLAMVAQVAAELERDGSAVLSEAEVIAIEAAEGRSVYSAQLADGRRHRPDLVAVEGPVAIEVELSVKARWRLEAIIRAWRAAVGQGRVSAVRYLCSQRTLGAVSRAVGRTCTEQLVEVAALDDTCAATYGGPR